MTGSGVATVARQELRLRVRAGRWKLLLAAFFAVLVAFTALLQLGTSQVAVDELPHRGTVLYGGLVLFVLGLALLVVPSLAAQSVNGDRERGTLATLQVTRLTPGELTLGKFVAAWGTALVFLAVTFPLVGYAMTQGGVPLGRVLVVTVVLALLLGTVCAVSLWLSSALARTTTSGVLAYLVVFALAVGTVVVFALVTAVTTERYTQTYPTSCPAAAAPGCVPGTRTVEQTRVRTDRTWWLVAPNPFVVLADVAPRLPEDGGASGLDPLGAIGDGVRVLRDPPVEPSPTGATVRAPEPVRPVWPLGLAVNVALGAGALVLTARRLRTPSRTLPRGQRVA